MEFSGIKMESQTDDRQVLVGWKMWNQDRVAFLTTGQPEELFLYMIQYE